MFSDSPVPATNRTEYIIRIFAHAGKRLICYTHPVKCEVMKRVPPEIPEQIPHPLRPSRPLIGRWIRIIKVAKWIALAIPVHAIPPLLGGGRIFPATVSTVQTTLVSLSANAFADAKVFR